MGLIGPGECPGLVRVYGYVDAESLLRQQIFDVLRPFHQTEAAAVEIVVKSYVYGLGVLGDAVEVKVVDWLTIGGNIFVYYGERRGAYRVGHAETLA